MSSINPLYRFIAAGVLALVGLTLLLPGSPVFPGDDAAADISLDLYCAAALRKPIEQIAERYLSEHGVRINIQYGGSNTLLSQIEAARVGDLFLAADDSYLTLARKKGLAADIYPIAEMTAVVVTSAERAAAIQSIHDLAGLRLSLAAPDQAAIGRVTRSRLLESGDWSALDAAVRRSGVYKPTVGDVANDVAVGAVDAGIVWDAVAPQHPGIAVVRLPELSEVRGRVGVAVLTASKHQREAVHFANLLAHDAGIRRVLAAAGYQPPRDDAPAAPQ